MSNNLATQTSALATIPTTSTIATFQATTAHLQAISLGGNANSAVAVSASVTVVKATAGYLARVLVTTVGTADCSIYDNASAGSGTVVAFIPANTPAGAWVDCQAPCANGITVGGSASNPALTVFYA